MKIKHWIITTGLACAAATANSAELEITVTNLTHGITFTPLLVAAHSSDAHLFQVGTAASDSLELMAEMGDISMLSTDAQGLGAAVVENPAEGFLAPGASTTSFMLDSGDHAYLSLTAMLLPTNDGFVGLDSWMIPSTPGTYTVMLNGYDAGTEANTELLSDTGGLPSIPGNPSGSGGTGGTGVTTNENNTTVHIHRGNLGDSNPDGGMSDLNSSVHRWLNPVAKLVVTVSE